MLQYCGMENKSMTAVEWLWLNLTDDMIGELSPEQIKSIYDLVQEAKEMEKQQIIDAVDGFPLENRNMLGEEYYIKTFNKK